MNSPLTFKQSLVAGDHRCNVCVCVCKSVYACAMVVCDRWITVISQNKL